MKLYQIPNEVREEQYEEGGEVYDGDALKCGGCNWAVDGVWMLGKTPEEAIDAFRENHRGLCGNCMCELLTEKCARGSEIMETP